MLAAPVAVVVAVTATSDANVAASHSSSVADRDAVAGPNGSQKSQLLDGGGGGGGGRAGEAVVADVQVSEPGLIGGGGGAGG